MKKKPTAPPGYILIPKPKNPGRKPVMRPCPFCKKEFGAMDLRAHKPRCPKKKRT